ncbi:uncharacterized protein LOC134230531 [Saccostrea cucullata]|uniref:uncharacterized protein LOC134230531 n=1 Tax=Saccostrea cuccullata TaxID=36930 RepID=UPI002ED518FE
MIHFTQFVNVWYLFLKIEISGLDSTVGDGPTCSDNTIQEENQLSKTNQGNADAQEPNINKSTSSTATSTNYTYRKSRKADTRNNTRNRGKLAELEEENMKLDNQRLRMQINQLNENKEILTLKKEILMLKKSKLEFEIQANYPFFTEALSANQCTDISEC